MSTRVFREQLVFSVAVGVALVVSLTACGSDTVTPPPPPPTTLPPLPPPSVVSTGQGSLPRDFVGRATPFTTTMTGNLDATVDWTFATNDLDVFIARGDCTPQQFFDRQCNIAAFSVSDTAKPERVQLTAAPPGLYTLLVGNVGPQEESLSWQVVLTPVRTAFSATAASSGTDRGLQLPAKAMRYRGASGSW
jgi:hypothetical protein